ncbi:MAG: carboxypeptidase-like regulatory domain-containing protein [Breznakibacter sp.]
MDLFKMELKNLLFTILLAMSFGHVAGQTVTGDFPEEPLNTRLNKIAKLAKRDISFDSKLVGGLKTPPMQAVQMPVEQAVVQSLKNTGLTYRKMADNSLIIVKQQPANTPPSGKGSISGKVADGRGEPLPGVAVAVQGTTIGTFTDIDGKYSLRDIPAGIHTIEMRFISYETAQVKDLQIDPGRTIPLDVTLKEASEQLGEVTVTAQHNQASTIGLLARQRESVAMIDGISADQMKLTADNNVAQVLKRVAGVTMQDNRFVVVRGMAERYNNVQLNGSSLPSTEPNRRNFSFEHHPQ